MKTNEPRPLYNARMVLNLTTAEAGQFVHVTRKTWEQWEKLEAENLPVPKAKMELFFEKIKKLGNTRDYGKIVVIFLTEESGLQQPIDVVAESNYLGLDGFDSESPVIKSMVVDRATGRPYVHRTKFLWDGNEHVKDFYKNTKPQV